MNKVRLIAVVAASVGAAIFAGTLFQPETPTQVVQPRPAAETAPPSIVNLAAEPAPVAPVDPVPQAIAAVERAPVEAGTSAGTGSGGEMPQAASLLPTIPSQRAPQTPVGGLIANLEPAGDTRADIGVLPIDETLRAELDACAVWLVVTPEPGAMLETSLYAPCDGGDAVEVLHGGLSFDTVLGADGQLLLMLPALTDQAEVVITFADGREVRDSADVPGFSMYERVVLQWSGAPVLGLHAYEFGAVSGGVGHVHADAPRAAGVLTLLGDPALEMAHLAQVYTLPPAATAESGDVVLDLEIAITAQSCGQRIVADLLHVRAESAVRQHRIALEMPECDGTGGFVVLNNLLPTMTLALN